MLQSKEKVGTLDREITIIQAIIEIGTSNEDKIVGWEEIDDYPQASARKIENSGDTFLNSADRVSWSKSTTWIIRYRENFESRNISNIDHLRLVWDTMVYKIITIDESQEGRKRYMNVVTQLLDREFFT